MGELVSSGDLPAYTGVYLAFRASYLLALPLAHRILLNSPDSLLHGNSLQCLIWLAVAADRGMCGRSTVCMHGVLSLRGKSHIARNSNTDLGSCSLLLRPLQLIIHPSFPYSHANIQGNHD